MYGTEPATLRDHLLRGIINQSNRLTVVQLGLVLECVDKLGKMDLKDFAGGQRFEVHIIETLEAEEDGNGEIPIY